MKQADERRIAFYKDCWHSPELSNVEKEGILQDALQHKYLRHVWDLGYDIPEWVRVNDIPGHTLVDVIHVGRM